MSLSETQRAIYNVLYAPGGVFKDEMDAVRAIENIYDKRISDLIEATNREVERRREAERVPTTTIDPVQMVHHTVYLAGRLTSEKPDLGGEEIGKAAARMFRALVKELAKNG